MREIEFVKTMHLKYANNSPRIQYKSNPVWPCDVMYFLQKVASVGKYSIPLQKRYISLQ